MANGDPPEGEEKELEVEHPGSEGGSVESVLAMHEPIAREKAEPADGYEPLPTWLVFVFFGLIGWGGWYLGKYTADFRSDVFRVEDASAARVPAVTAPAPRDPAQTGELLYRRLCTACHQASGEGLAGSFPPLARSEYVIGDPARLVRIVLNGLEGPITVRGSTYAANMPAWAPQLDDFELAAVATYVRNQFGNSAPPVPEALVAELRKLSASRGRPWTVEELEQAEPVTVPEGAAKVDAGAAGDASPAGNPPEQGATP
jgi:mono/diheme cytochrome c family protein